MVRSFSTPNSQKFKNLGVLYTFSNFLLLKWPLSSVCSGKNGERGDCTGEMSRSCPCLRPVVWSPLASLSPYKNGSHKVFIIQQTDPDHNVQGKPWHARILHVHSFVVFQLNKIQKYLAHFFTRILEMIGSRYISVITVFKNWSFVYESIFSNEISNRR